MPFWTALTQGLGAGLGGSAVQAGMGALQGGQGGGAMMGQTMPTPQMASNISQSGIGGSPQGLFENGTLEGPPPPDPTFGEKVGGGIGKGLGNIGRSAAQGLGNAIGNIPGSMVHNAMNDKFAKNRMDTLYPNTSPWERLKGASGGLQGAGKGSEQSEAMKMKRMELKNARTIAQIQARSASNVATIQSNASMYGTDMDRERTAGINISNFSRSVESQKQAKLHDVNAILARTNVGKTLAETTNVHIDSTGKTINNALTQAILDSNISKAKAEALIKDIDKDIHKRAREADVENKELMWWKTMSGMLFDIGIFAATSYYGVGGIVGGILKARKARKAFKLMKAGVPEVVKGATIKTVQRDYARTVKNLRTQLDRKYISQGQYHQAMKDAGKLKDEMLKEIGKQSSEKLKQETIDAGMRNVGEQIKKGRGF